MNPDDPLAAFKTSAIHGTGGFARLNLRKGQRIIERIGPRLAEVDLPAKQDVGNASIFLLDATGADEGSVAWHPARFLNPSGDPSGDLTGEPRIECGRAWLYAWRAIQANEALTSHDGNGLSGYPDRICRCGAAACVGFGVAAHYAASCRKRLRST